MSAVKKNSALRKNFLRTVCGSMGRFLAIALIIALGAAMYTGLRTTRDAMVLTARRYLDRNLFYDFRILNTYGFEEQDIRALSRTEGIAAAEGCYSADVLADTGSEKDAVFRVHSLPLALNTAELVCGRMPTHTGECVADEFYFTEADLGTVINLSEANGPDTLDTFSGREFTVVGIVRTPLYINFERGSTSIGTGKVSAYLYVLPSCFNLPVYTEAYLRMEGSYDIYSDAYTAAADAETPAVEEAAQAAADARKARICDDASAELAEAEQQYEDGLAEYESQRADAEAQLSEAAAEIADGQAQIDENRALLEENEAALQTAEAQIAAGQRELSAGQSTLNAKKKQAFAELDAAAADLADKRRQAEDGLAQVTDGIAQATDGIAQIDDGLAQIADAEAQIEKYWPYLSAGLPAAKTAAATAQRAAEKAAEASAAVPGDEVLKKAAEDAAALNDAAQQALAGLEAKYDEMAAARETLPSQKAALEAARQTASETLDTLYATQAELEDGLAQIAAGEQELARQRASADAQLASAQAEIDSGKKKLSASRSQAESGRARLEDGRAQLADAEAELAAGRAEYESARSEADKGFAEAEAELDDAARQIADARAQIEEIADPDVYVLDRTTNIGYSCFEGDADIVRNVSKVFPVFFFLIAALVCMTTVDKMVDEERGQIGTLKALGYTDGSILSKYLLYAGSAALAGSLLGCLAGTLGFPAILWKAYSIMYCMPAKTDLYVNMPLCAVMTAGYTLAMLAVAYFSCRMTLRAVPAELIRPKSPPAGKRLLAERLFFWKYLPFLHKVTFRNIFRYKKRLFMTLIGVGGCTALLVTGFGFRDSIMDVAEIQFEDLTHYDLQVNFSVGLPEPNRELFRLVGGQYGAQTWFLYLGSVDCTDGSRTKSTSLAIPFDPLDGVWNLVCDGEPLPMPGEGEVLVSKGLAESLGLSPGDRITATDAEMKQLSLTVSGVFDNHVYTYLIVSPETVLAQWGEVPDPQTSLLTVPDDADASAVGAVLAHEDHVIAVNVTSSLLDWVSGVMSSLNAIVVLLVGMAAGLAFIVLYNLTNININERIREIATINVLGFRKKETWSYLFRESLVLAFLGSLLGLVLGKLLHAFVMDNIRIDMMNFPVRVTPMSYLISVALTMVFAVLVNVALTSRLERINMAEALKSGE